MVLLPMRIVQSIYHRECDKNTVYLQAFNEDQNSYCIISYERFLTAKRKTENNNINNNKKPLKTTKTTGKKSVRLTTYTDKQKMDGEE